MSLNREQFAVVLGALRARVRGGAQVQGEPLIVVDLARQWGVSPTPVREALCRLAGEGLIEDRRGRGYFTWRTDVSDLTDLYRAQESLTARALAAAVLRFSSALAAASPLIPGTIVGPDEFRRDAIGAWEAVFSRIGAAAGNRFLLGSQQRLADRLAPARRAEPAVLDESSADFNALADALGRGAWKDLETVLEPFFERRRTAAENIVSQMRLMGDKYIV